MGNQCSVCAHARVDEINTALLSKGKSKRQIGREFGLNKNAIGNHAEHLARRSTNEAAAAYGHERQTERLLRRLIATTQKEGKHAEHLSAIKALAAFRRSIPVTTTGTARAKQPAQEVRIRVIYDDPPLASHQNADAIDRNLCMALGDLVEREEMKTLAERSEPAQAFAVALIALLEKRKLPEALKTAALGFIKALETETGE